MGQRSAWILTWAVLCIPVYAFNAVFDSSAYSLGTQMLLGDFLFYGYLLFVAFGLSERVSFNLGLFSSRSSLDSRDDRRLTKFADIECITVYPEMSLIIIKP